MPAWRFGRFDRRRRFAAWLHRIAANRSIDAVRQRERRNELELRLQDEPEVSSDQALPPRLLAALDALDPAERAIVVLRHLLDYRSAEIGSMLDMPAGTVRRRLAGAIERMRTEVDRGEETRR